MMVGEHRIARRARARVAVFGGALGAVCLVLTGCSAVGASQDTVVYSAWVDGGSIASGQYYLIDGGNGAMSYPIEPGVPDAASWSMEVDGGGAPSVEITATEGGVAHCVISSPGTGAVLAHADATSGLTARCEKP